MKNDTSEILLVLNEHETERFRKWLRKQTFELPVDTSTQNGSSNYRDAQANETDDIEYPPMWAIMSESDKALWLRTRREVRAAYRDAPITKVPETFRKQCNDQANEASAEFPEAEFKLWFNTPLPDRSCRTICEYWFKRGRAQTSSETIVDKINATAFQNAQNKIRYLLERNESLTSANEILRDKNKVLEAKLAETQAEIERLTKELLHAQQRSENQKRRPDKTE